MANTMATTVNARNLMKYLRNYLGGITVILVEQDESSPGNVGDPQAGNRIPAGLADEAVEMIGCRAALAVMDGFVVRPGVRAPQSTNCRAQRDRRQSTR